MTAGYGLAAALLVSGVSAAASGWWFYGAGQAAEVARRAGVVATERVIQDAVDRAGQASAKASGDAIAKLEIKRVQITQPMLREIREKVVYADCRHSPDGLRNVNDALTGPTTGPVGSQLPPAAGAGAGG